MLSRWFGRSDIDTPARSLYRSIVAQARRPEFYARFGVPDTLDGRFELIALHAFLVMHRLKREHERTKQASQALFDEMFADLDRSLREMGAGDLGVGRRVKELAKSFYGRVRAYEAGIAAGGRSLEDALARDLLGTTESAVDADVLAALGDYVRMSIRGLAEQPIDELLAGRVGFSAPVLQGADAP